jgi:hypothetical protein
LLILFGERQLAFLLGALKTSSFALAESIPTELGKLINITVLSLTFNRLSGTLSLHNDAFFYVQQIERYAFFAHL